jgi:hypothetical protein
VWDGAEQPDAAQIEQPAASQILMKTRKR